MKHWLLAGFLALTPIAVGQDGHPLTEDDATALTGRWSVEDHVLIGRADPGDTAWLIFNEPYADFELELEFKTPVPCNGGVQVRSHWLAVLPVPEGLAPADAPKTMHGYQVNIDTQKEDATGSILIEHGRPPLAGPAPDAQQAVRPRDWNTLRIVAKGPLLETVVNGVVANRVEDERALSGFLALQVVAIDDAHPGEVHYRNIRIEDLGRLGRWRPLFDGATLDGWVEWGTEEWAVENGVIIGRSGPKKSEGYLATRETWTDFRVRGAFKMLGQGNFGLFYHATVRLRDDGYPVISGIQGEVEPNCPGETGGLYESYRRGWLAQTHNAAPAAYLLRLGDWNQIEIRSRGNHVTTWVNGHRAVDFRDATPQLFRGAFALQLHTGGVDGIAWKDLYVLDPG